MRYRKYKFEWLLLVHLFVGMAFAIVPFGVVFWVLIVLLFYGILPTIWTRNTTGHAHVAAAYLAGFEMTIRTADVPLPWETTKYSVILLLIIGLLSEHKVKKAPISVLVLTLALIPSILVMDFSLGFNRIRQDLSSNLAGPLCLAISMWYFFRRTLSREQVAGIFRMALLSITTTLGLLFIKTPDIREIEFTYTANFTASGFGPNQMASVLGFGILVIITTLLLRLSTFKLKVALWVLLAMMLYRGLLTFSRGGMIGPLIAIIAGLLYFFAKNGIIQMRFLKRIVVGALVILIGYAVFSYVNEQSGGKLYDRYAGIREGGKKLDWEKYSSGRIRIAQIDLDIFQDYPLLGVGPGMGTHLRPKYGYGKKVAAHIEFTRLLAEHGILGIIALTILFGLPIKEFWRRRHWPEMNFLLITMVLSTFAFMSHSATRIALPMFMYGFAFCYMVPEGSNWKTTLHSSVNLHRKTFYA